MYTVHTHTLFRVDPKPKYGGQEKGYGMSLQVSRLLAGKGLDPPNVLLLRALWSLLDAIWGILKGSGGVLGSIESRTLGFTSWILLRSGGTSNWLHH